MSKYFFGILFLGFLSFVPFKVFAHPPALINNELIWNLNDSGVTCANYPTSTMYGFPPEALRNDTGYTVSTSTCGSGLVLSFADTPTTNYISGWNVVVSDRDLSGVCDNITVQCTKDLILAQGAYNATYDNIYLWEPIFNKPESHTNTILFVTLVLGAFVGFFVLVWFGHLVAKTPKLFYYGKFRKFLE